MNRVKMGVIGLGWFGVKHCEALAAIPQVELAAVCTRTESRLAEVANSFDVPVACTDYNQLLADPEICLLYTSPSPRDRTRSRMPSSA